MAITARNGAPFHLTLRSPMGWGIRHATSQTHAYTLDKLEGAIVERAMCSSTMAADRCKRRHELVVMKTGAWKG